jgi:alcohol dehydrogenase (cytochrome c)
LCGLGIALVVLLTVVASLLSHTIAWRFVVLGEKVSGKIPEIPYPFLFRWMVPGSPVYLEPMSRVSNVNSSIINHRTDRDSIDAGAKVYGRVCAQCHGENARGQTGPNLVAAIGNITDWTFFSTVRWGRPRTAMTAQPLSDLQIWQLHAFIRQAGIDAALGKHSDDDPPSPFQPISSDAIRSANNSGNWLTYGGNYAALRHAKQHQISSANVADLGLAWVTQLRPSEDAVEATPLVDGKWMYLTEAPEGVTALDSTTGTILWKFHRPVPSGIPLCCGFQNRGVALLGDSVFVETLDAHLVALDAMTGRKRWDVQVADWHDGYSMTGAPLAVEDRIVVGVAGGEFGIRGFLAAYSAKDGSLQWKFYTVPGPGEPGYETWQNGDSKHGGAPTWTTGAYDPELGLIFWGTGNPGPEYQGDARPGDNLFSNSEVALDARTGKLRWYFQFLRGDEHDWDSTQQPVLANIPWQGESRPAVLVAARNAFFYALDRQTGRLLFAKPYAKETWASPSPDADGRPLMRPDARPSHSGTLLWPSVTGGTNWWPPSFDPQRQLFFVQAVDAASLYFRDRIPQFHRGEIFTGSTTQYAASQPASTVLRAIDVSNGKLRWERILAAGGDEVKRAMTGVLSTDGDLVFAGYQNEFFALQAGTGEKLWSTELGGAIHAPPITYTIDGQQYVSVIAAKTVFTFTLPRRLRARGSASGKP